MGQAGPISETSFNKFLENFSKGHGDGMMAVDEKEVKLEDYIGKDKNIPTIKALEKRLKAIDKEEEDAVAKLREEKKDIASTDMTREEQIRLLNIIKENGISLREGSTEIKMYYEIAKASFLEGLAKGLKL